jgi:hypothetical protein
MGRQAAVADLALAQSPALRFTRDCLLVTGKKDFTETDSMFKRYWDWAMEEERLAASERGERQGAITFAQLREQVS